MLALRSKYKTKASSTDLSKHYQNMSCFNSSPDTPTNSESTSDGDLLMLNDPVASVLCSDNHLFLCVGEILSIHVNSRTVEQVSDGQLHDKLTSVTFQLLFLVPATVDNDPEKKHDWRPKCGITSQFTVPGHLILPLNPTTKVSATGKLQFLFKSFVLYSVAAAFLDVSSLQDAKSINTFRNEYFPCHEVDTSTYSLSESQHGAHNSKIELVLLLKAIQTKNSLSTISVLHAFRLFHSLITDTNNWLTSHLISSLDPLSTQWNLVVLVYHPGHYVSVT